jgi:pyruvate carboxylase
MTMFLITRGIKPADVVNLDPGVTPFPESVKDMLRGGLGQPMGGWPKQLQKVVLGQEKPLKGRPGADLPPIDFKAEKRSLAAKLKREITEDDLFSHLMYPEVFTDFARFQREYGDVRSASRSRKAKRFSSGSSMSVRRTRTGAAP